MLLGFKQRFVPFIEEGSKTHTIRAIRRLESGDIYTPKVGEICHCYVNPRQKSMRLLGRFPCVRVERIEIEYRDWKVSAPLVVTIDSVRLTDEEADLLFLRDGFRDLTGETYQHMQQAAEFWKDRTFPFHGLLIHWKYLRGTTAEPHTSRKGRVAKL